MVFQSKRMRTSIEPLVRRDPARMHRNYWQVLVEVNMHEGIRSILWLISIRTTTDGSWQDAAQQWGTRRCAA